MSDLEREILGYLAARSGEVSFYHLARQFGYDASHDLPGIVEKFKCLGLIEEGPLAGDMPLLLVTPAGKGLAQQVAEPDAGKRGASSSSGSGAG